MGLKTAYLVGYNVASMAGWAWLWALLYKHYAPQAGKPLLEMDHASLYGSVGPALDLVQTAAVLEIVHSVRAELDRNPPPTPTTTATTTPCSCRRWDWCGRRW